MDQANQLPMQGTPEKSVGPVIGIIIIVIILIVGAFYFWGARLNTEPAPVPPQTQTAPLSASDEVGDINTDLSATAINGVDDNVGAIQTELNQ